MENGYRFNTLGYDWDDLLSLYRIFAVLVRSRLSCRMKSINRGIGRHINSVSLHRKTTGIEPGRYPVGRTVIILLL